MDSLHLMHAGPSRWIQHKAMDKSFELFAGERLIGTLDFRSAFGTYAKVVTSIQSWTFKRVGFLNARITIRKPDEDLDYATLYPRLFGDGVLQIMDGHTYRWAPLNFWRTKWVFYDSGDIPILRFEEGTHEFNISEAFKTQADVFILSPSLDDIHLSLLVSLGFYLVVMYKNDAAAGAAAASAS